MREIKFRAWDVKNNKFIDGYAITCDGTIFSFKEGDCEDYIRGHADIPNTILIQYTGLKDKNGKEIYEGDIVSVCFVTGKENCEIVEEKGCYWVSQKRTDYIRDMAHDNLYWHIDGCEVIGNIYENPELLKGGEKVI